MPLLAGLLVVLSLATLSISLGRVNLRSAERERVAERARLTRQIGSYVSQAYAADKLRADVADAPFNAATPTLNQLLLQQFQVTPTGDPNVIVALFDRRGHQIAARPERNSLTVGVLGDAWQQALRGQVKETQSFRIDSELLRAYAVPVGAGTPWAVLVAVPRDESGQQFQQRLGGLGAKSGGFFTVDANGIGFTAHDPALIGRRLLTPAEMAALHATGFRQWTTGTGSSQTITIGAVNPGSGYAQVFSQRTADLFADLRSAQRTRDITVLATLMVAMAGLALLGWRRERTTRRAAARLHALLKHAHDLVLVVAADGSNTFVSPAIEDLLGYQPADWVGRPLLDLVHPGDTPRVSAMLVDPHLGRLLNIRLRAADGTVRWFDVESSDHTSDTTIAGVLLTCHDVGERKELQDQLSYRANHDELTGLANRAVFAERLELQRSNRLGNGEQPFAVLFVDLDHFKPVNDALGHDAGDQVLRTIAARLSATVRSEDLVCRFGGDEFGVLLPGADEVVACDIATRLVRAASSPIAVGATLVRVDASIGITLAGGGSVPPGADLLIREADEAMYLAKQAGRGRYAVHPGRSTRVRVPEQAVGATAATERSLPAVSAGPDGYVRPLKTLGRRSMGARIRHLLPLLVAGLLVVGIAGLGSVQEARAGADAENRRVSERSDLTLRVADYSAMVTDPRRLLPAVGQAPWNLDDLAANGAVLEAFSHSPAAGPNSVVAISSLDGRVAATYPAGATVGLPTSSPAWLFGRRGVAALSGVQDATTLPRGWYALPVSQNGKPRALLLIGQSERDAEISKLMQAVGSLGFGEGGLAAVDPGGTVYVAWDARLIGTKLVQPTDLVGVAPGHARHLERDGQTLLIAAAWRPGDPSRRYIVFQQPTGVFFGDLRKGQATRNLLLLVLVCASVLGFALLNRRRELSDRRAKARLQAFLHHAHDLVIAIDGGGRITFVSSAIEGLLGHDTDDWGGRQIAELVTPEDRIRLDAALRGTRGGANASADLVVPDVRLRTIDGGTRWFDVSIADLRHNPAVVGLLLTCHEIGERKRLQDELSHRARHDVLTGLPNRATFAEHLAAVTADGAGGYAVLFLDLDHFKPVNDCYGHDIGDAVLQAVAGRLDAAVRQSGPRRGDLISRLGGDEFAVVLSDVDSDEARRVADRVLHAIGEPIRIGSLEVRVGVTIGIAFADSAGYSAIPADTVVRQADSAMYEAKAAGRGRYAVFGS